MFNPVGLNEELENALIIVVESLKKQLASEQLQTYLSSTEITIHRQCREPKVIKNKLHWIYDTNDASIVDHINVEKTLVLLRDRPEEPMGEGELVMHLRESLAQFVGRMITLPLVDKLPGV